MLNFASSKVFVTGLLLCASAGYVQAMTPDKFYAATSPSVWRVLSQDAQGTVFAQGSAVVIAPGTLITNCHVIAKAKKISVKQENVTLEARLQYIDVERDLCQITARNLTSPIVQMGDSSKIAVGQHIYTIGNPIGMERTLSDGLVSALRKDETQLLRYIQISAPISSGSSGGGLFDEDGKLIGVTSAYIEKGQNLNLAIPVNFLRELPARSAIALAKFENKTAEPTNSVVSQSVNPVATAPEYIKVPAPPASGYAAISDVAKLDKFGARKGYEEFLGKGLPRAFAIVEGGGWYIASGNTPKGPGISPEPHMRALSECIIFYRRSCTLYAVDDVVVYRPEINTNANNPIIEKKGSPPPPSLYADISDIKKLDAFGARKGYEEFLTKAFPRAFVIGPGGWWSWSYGTDLKDPDSPEPYVRSMAQCERKLKQTCYLYAVDGNVVYQPAKALDVYTGKTPIPPASGYADISDIDKLDKFGARKAYDEFLHQSFPRAFAVTDAGGGYFSHGVNPKDLNFSEDPHVRILKQCESHYKRQCYLYAVNGVVVYNPANKNDNASK